MLALMLSMIAVVFMWSTKFTNCQRSTNVNITVSQFDTIRLDCYSGYDESADWYFHDRFGDTNPIYSSGYLQPQEKTKYSITSGSGYYNLTTFNVSFEDIGRYECREGWGVGGRPRHYYYVNVTDIDECSSSNVCDLNANCSNTQGSFICMCKDGFTGNGFECKDVNECDKGSTCDVNAHCNNTIGGFTCTCKHGYVELLPIGGCTELTDVEASIGDNVYLSCPSAPPLAPIAWLFVELSNSVNGTYLYRNTKATMTKTSWEFSSQSAGDYSIVLKGVKLDESGYYVCYEEGGKTNKGYKLNITVPTQMESKSAVSSSTVAGMVVPAVLLSVVLVVVVGVVCLIKRLRHTANEHTELMRLSPVKHAHVIAPREDRKGRVRGLTVQGDEQFIVRLWPQGHIEVYSASTFTFKHNIKVKELEGSWCYGLTACDSNNCLYVSYLRVDGVYIARVELTGDNNVLEWKVEEDCLPEGLSVNNEHNLIVACRGWPNKLIEYTTCGELVREILLQDDIKYLHHAIQLNSCQYLVSHGWGDDSLHRVCVVDANGRVLLSYGNKHGSKSGQLNCPRHLAVHRNGFIFIADSENKRIVVLDSELKWSRDLQRGDDGDDMKQPCSLYLDEQRNLLFVGEVNDKASRVVKVTL